MVHEKNKTVMVNSSTTINETKKHLSLQII